MEYNFIVRTHNDGDNEELSASVPVYDIQRIRLKTNVESTSIYLLVSILKCKYVNLCISGAVMVQTFASKQSKIKVPIGQKAMLYYVIIGAIRVTEMILMF
jgi:hypothetical protein